MSAELLAAIALNIGYDITKHISPELWEQIKRHLHGSKWNHRNTGQIIKDLAKPTWQRTIWLY